MPAADGEPLPAEVPNALDGSRLMYILDTET